MSLLNFHLALNSGGSKRATALFFNACPYRTPLILHRRPRLLFHKAACSDERLASGMVLPISMAMKRHEAEYLAALKSFSKPARDRWTVEFVSADNIRTTLSGDPDIYRYWDGALCAEFGLQMAQEALREDLMQEIVNLRRYDAAYRAVNAAVDLNNADLVLLVRSIVANEGLLSGNRQKKLIAKGHPADLIETAVAAATQALTNLQEELKTRGAAS